jgi:hypothetical protein
MPKGTRRRMINESTTVRIMFPCGRRSVCSSGTKRHNAQTIRLHNKICKNCKGGLKEAETVHIKTTKENKNSIVCKQTDEWYENNKQENKIK